MYFEFDEPKVGAKDPPITADDLISGYLSKKEKAFFHPAEAFSAGLKKNAFFHCIATFLKIQEIFSEIQLFF